MDRLREVFDEAFDTLIAEKQWVPAPAGTLTVTLQKDSAQYQLNLRPDGGYLLFICRSDLMVPGEYQAKVLRLLEQLTEEIPGRFLLEGVHVVIRFRHGVENFDALPHEINSVAQSMLSLQLSVEKIVRLVLRGENPAVALYLSRDLFSEA